MADVPPVEKIPEAKKERFDKLRSTFISKYGTEPDYFARAPGRVNLIGEHIDYCGYAVLPMAIEQDVIFATSSNADGKITFSNLNPVYKDFECDVSDITIPKDNPQWYFYALCGVKGMMEHMKKTTALGFNCVVEGTVPPSAGLSSSSALVCCAALTMMQANGWSLSKQELADMCAHCEHYIGTEGGGMDQAISFMAKHGTAKLIEFNPLRSTDVKLPFDTVFVISNSCVQANKAASSNFNIRVVECRIATQILAKSNSLEWKGIKKFAELQSLLLTTLDEMIDKVNKTFHKEPYTKTEICSILEVTPEELASTSLSENTLNVESFKLYQRASHVYNEAKRVVEFKQTCDLNASGTVEKLGELMTASHDSCRDLYECSHPDLDNLVQICLKSGALGSRLTGAGWGGCAVSMVRATDVLNFLAKVRDEYYLKSEERSTKILESLFATEPGAGAAIYKV
ncbi:hypothetical protein SNE40_004791 [Patella caerulea]|uniref:Galactokinase n=1 Tax=Patella caerulea TaxID=87958 RepID=A0AAN8K3R6_PATCE